MPGHDLRVTGTVRVPGDKSVSHRALILSALATGQSRIRGILQSHDVQSTAGALRSLGWSLPPVSDEMAVEGGGLRRPTTSAVCHLDCGNSGTTARLLAGVAAAQPFISELAGDASLSRRPMRRVAAPLEAMGARIEFPAGFDGLPMRVHGGTLHPVAWELPVASAQLKSAVLLAGLCAGVSVRVREPAPSRDHTEQMLSSAGVEIRQEDGWIDLRPVDALAPIDLDVPGDPSSAAFFVALALLADEGQLELPNVLRNPLRDGFLRTILRMGARVREQTGNAPGGLSPPGLIAEPSELTGTTVVAEDVPSMLDEIPVLAVLAARASGETIVRGAGELRVKESDRISTLVTNLRAIGVEARELPDGLVVQGTRAPLGGHVVTYGDHRIAMAFAVLGATRACDVELDDRDCVTVSYPSFWSDLAHVVR